jgi:hypothetical protein
MPKTPDRTHIRHVREKATFDHLKTAEAMAERGRPGAQRRLI